LFSFVLNFFQENKATLSSGYPIMVKECKESFQYSERTSATDAKVVPVFSFG